jgi:hypothetical protein
VQATLLDPPYLMKDDMIAWCNEEGVRHPRLLLKTNPERYKYHEEKEEEMRKFLDKDVTILRYQEGNQRKKITLKQLRERTDKQCEMFDEWGGCGCFSTFDDDEMDGDEGE